MFTVYVNDAKGRQGHWAAALGLPAWWRADALHFPTMESAEEFIERMGWIHDTSVRPGWTTAYVTHGSR